MRHPLRPFILGVALSGCTLDTAVKSLGAGSRGGRDSGGESDGGDGGVDGDDATDTGGGTTSSDTGRVRTSGREFWLAYMENLDLTFNGPPEFGVLIDAPDGAIGRIEVPATGYMQEWELAPGEQREVRLPSAIWYPEGSEEVGIFGVKVSADRDIEAVALHWRLYFSEASRLLPIDELDGDYRVLTVPDAMGSGPNGFIVVATEDNTEVAITPAAFTYGLRPEDVEYSVILNEGEVWPVHADGDLSGSRVRSVGGAPIAVFAGAKQPWVGCTAGANSHVWDQLPPVDRWGRHTVVVPFARRSADTVRMVAHEDGTEIQVDCGPPTVLDAGEPLSLEISDATSITSSAPVLVAQVMQGGDCGTGGSVGDPNLVFVTPAPLTRIDARVTVPLATESLASATRHVGVWSPEGDAVEIDDGTPLDAGDGATGTLDGGIHTLTSDGPFNGTVYALGVYDALTWTLGYDCVGCVLDLDAAPACD